MGFFDDSKKSLALRVQRIIGTDSGWTEDPPSRTGRFVTNVRTFTTASANEYLVESNLLVTRSRTDVANIKLLSARRRDTIRSTDNGLRIARREIYTHQATIDMQNLAIFL
jgi:3-phenylpropionate/cinnamic acid dioxygenase small subunit